MKRCATVTQDDLPLLLQLQVRIACKCCLLQLEFQRAVNTVQKFDKHASWLMLTQAAQTNPSPTASSSANAYDLIRSIKYISQALQYIARNCKHLEELSLWLPASPASSNRGGPLDHPSLLKRPHFKLTQLWGHCQMLKSLTLVNVPSR